LRADEDFPEGSGEFEMSPPWFCFLVCPAPHAEELDAVRKVIAVSPGRKKDLRNTGAAK
jgi:hypothetical protein